MNRIITLIAVLLTAFTYGQNLVSNGSFESDFESWTNLQGDNGSKATYSVEASDSKDGSKALKLEMQTVGENPWDVQTLTDLRTEKGRNYAVKFWAKAETAGGKIRIQVQKTTYTSNDYELSTDWKEYQWSFDAKEDDLQLALHFFMEGVFYIDGISIESSGGGAGNSATAAASGPKKGLNLMSNGNFENGYDGWTNLADNGANAVYTINDQDAKEGGKGMRTLILALGANPWDAQSLYTFPSIKNQKYKLTFYAKSNGKNKKLRVQFQKNTYTPKDFIINDDWKKYEWVIGAKEHDLMFAFHWITPGLFEVDDIQIVQISGLNKKNKSGKKKKKRRTKTKRRK